MKATLKKRSRYWNEHGEDTIQIDNVASVEVYLGSHDLTGRKDSTGRWVDYGYHMAKITVEGGEHLYNLEVYHMEVSQ